MNFGITTKISVLFLLNIFLIGFALKSSEYFSYVNFIGRDFFGMLSNKIQEKIFLTEFDESVNVEQMKFDILQNDLRIKIIPNEKYLIGSVNTKLLILDYTDRIILNLDENLEITKINGTRGYKNYSHFGNVVEIYFEESLEPQDSIDITIEYHGHPREIGLAGFDFVEGTNRFYTLSQPNFAQSWWPCKDIPSDKFLASVEIIVPEKIVAVSNGSLVNIEQIDTNWISYSYEVSYPIASYLVSICGAEYKEFGNTFKSVSGKGIPLKYFVFEGKVMDAKKDFEVIPDMMRVFEKLYGEYPFQNEHYGIVEFDWQFGGMEHQTMTSIGSNYITGLRLHDKLLVHELAHEWFGNSVTLNDWNEIWLNEGFATYSAYLFLEFAGKKSRMNSDQLFYGSLFKPNGFLFGST
ncbi:MAG: M1 family metallopeptidase, partial [Bacteroidetes bacterium]|nr:M1 family metallopeptidase [Bacteroidota bacterium]